LTISPYCLNAGERSASARNHCITGRTYFGFDAAT
jgi:hypothetical protein